MKSRIENHNLVLIPETDLIASRIDELRGYFTQKLDEHEETVHVVLDVTGVDFVDSLGVNLIVGLYRQVTDDKKTVEIIGAGRDFMKVANFFRLPSLFSIKEG